MIFFVFICRIPRNLIGKINQLLQNSIERFYSFIIWRNQRKLILKMKKYESKVDNHSITELYLVPNKASILHLFNHHTFDYFWSQFQLSNLFVKSLSIFEVRSFVVLMELEIVILDLLDFYLCIKGRCWFQKFIEVYVSLEKLWINNQLDLGLSFWTQFNFSQPSLDCFRSLFFFWNIQCQLWPKELEFNQHWWLLEQGNRAGSRNQLFHFWS